MFTVYIIESLKNSKTYVGYTEKDVKIRLKEHNQGNSTWTKLNGPFNWFTLKPLSARQMQSEGKTFSSLDKEKSLRSL